MHPDFEKADKLSFHVIGAAIAAELYEIVECANRPVDQLPRDETDRRHPSHDPPWSKPIEKELLQKVTKETKGTQN